MAKTLLLVDDDRHILETARDILEEAGFDIQTAETGAQALQMLKGRPCHLMIVDYNLVDMTGVELTGQAKKLHPEIPVILMTGEANVDLGAAKSLIGEILTKPVNPAALIELIRKVLR